MVKLTLLATLAAATVGQTAHALPEDPGGYDVEKVTRTETLAGASVTFDLYTPKGLVGPAPVVAVGHGFQRTRANMAEWGDELARRGFVAAVPSFPGLVPDHPLNGKILSALLTWVEAEGQNPASPLSGKVDGDRRAVVGFSAGGLAALLAAAGDSSIDLVLGLDPVDSSGQGLGAAPSIQSPVVFVRAEPHQCNESGNAAAVFAKLGAARMSLVVSGATHCDGEAPSGPLCSAFCGAPLQARHLLFRRYAFAALDYVLRCETTMLPWLGGAQAQADTGIKDLTVSGFPPAPAGCATDPDGSPATLDASSADSGPGDAARPRDTGSDDVVQRDAPAPAGDDGCGCRSSRAPAPLPPLLLIVPLALAVLRRAP